jgi:hypothetical protein
MRAAALFMALGVTAVIAQSAPDFTTREENGRLTITKYNGWDTEIVIPASIGGKPVTAIGDEAFRKMDLTSVVMPDSVRTIGNYAFSGNNLTSVTIGKGVVSIGAYAFISNDLTSVTIPEGVIRIGKLSFRFNKLKAVVVPASVEVLGNWAFSDNPITDFTLGRDSNFVAFEGFLDNDRLERVTLPANLGIVDVRTFGEKIFYDYMCNGRKAATYTTDRNWTRKANIKEAESFRFIETAYGLAITAYTGEANRLVIPEQIGGKPVTYIEGTKSGLTGVRIPSTVTGFGWDSYSYVKGAFMGCSLTTIEIPSSVTYIGPRAFYGNELTSVTIPESVTYIGWEAFFRNKLKSVTIPSSVTFIGSEAFSWNELRHVDVSAKAQKIFFEDRSFGAFNDLDQASQTALNRVRREDVAPPGQEYGVVDK